MHMLLVLHHPKIIVGILSVQKKGNKWGDNSTEQHPRLQAAVLTLTKGPVCPSDKIGLSNRPLIMRSAMADGTLLQPSRPAMQLDMVFVDTAFGMVKDAVVANNNDPNAGNDNMITIIGIIVIDSLVYKLVSTDGAAIIHVKATPMESFLE